jgi:hypothetical protein
LRGSGGEPGSIFPNNFDRPLIIASKKEDENESCLDNEEQKLHKEDSNSIIKRELQLMDP